MNNYYATSGYRDARARDQAGLSKADGSRAQRGLVAPPGITVPAPAPPHYTIPPAVVAAPAAAAPWGAAAFAGVGGVLAGLGLGAWVKQDIDRFKRDSQLPWYDTQYPYRGSSDHLTMSNWDRGQEVFYDPYADAEIRRAIDRQVQEYYLNPYPMPPGFYAPDGRHGPTFTRTTGVPFPIRIWWEYVNTCPDNQVLGVTDWNTNGYSAGCVGGSPPTWTHFDNAGGSTGSGCGAVLSTATGLSAPFWQCDVNPNAYASVMGGIHRTGVGFAAVYLVEAWDYREAPATQAGIPPGGLEYGVGIIGDPILFDGPVAEPELGWGESVAPPGTQPSTRTRTKTKGRVVPQFLDFPLQVIDPGTGPGVITFPDVEVDVDGVRPIVPTRPVPPLNEEPPPEDEEDKPTLPGVGGRAWTALNFLTEAQDVLDALHKAIPKKCRTKGRKGGKVSPHIILADVWKCRSHFSSSDFIREFINNQVEDFLYGKTGKAAGRVQRASGGTTGLSRAVNAGSRFYGRAVKAGELEDDDWSPIPALTQDDDGGIYIDFGSYHISLR